MSALDRYGQGGREVAHDGRAIDRGGWPARLDRLRARLTALSLAAASVRPGVLLAGLLALDLAAAALFAATGAAVGDAALLFREGMPGTWLSFAELSLAAFVAWTVHQLERPDGAWHGDFWGLATVVFAVFAADEILGTSQLVGTWLNQAAGLSPAGAFRDVGAVLLTLLLAGGALVLLPRVLDVLRRPLAAALLGTGALLGAGSQALDSFVAPTALEFVAEETLKLCAGGVLLAGFVAALRAALATPPPGGRRPHAAA